VSTRLFVIAEIDAVAGYDPEFGMGEDMFKDLALSKEIMREYHDKLALESSGQKLTVMVLQRSAWPFTVPKSGIDLPPGVSLLITLRGCIIDWFVRRCKLI
jgi:cullin-4